jgi:ABC-type multidrug transport system fused ATPase/permease subunit
MSRPQGVAPAFRLSELVRRRSRWVSEFVLMSLVRALLTALVIYLIQQFLAGVLQGEQGLASRLASRLGVGSALYVVAGALGLTYVLSSVVTYRGQVVEQRLIREIELGVMERLTQHLLSLSLDFFDKSSAGDLVVALRQDVTRLRSVVAAQARLVFDAAQALALVASAWWLSPRLAMLSLVVVPLVAGPALWFARRTLRQSFTIRQGTSAMYDVLLQAIRGIRVIKVYGAEAAEAHRASTAARHVFDASIEQARLEAFGRVLVEGVAGLSIVAVVVVGGFDVLEGRLGWPSLLAFLLAIRSVHGPLNNINAQYLELQRYGASVARIAALFETRPSVADASHAMPFPTPLAEVELDNVGFAYADATVLEGIRLRARTGETIGIVGASGVGKSTLLGLLARFHDPTSGRILVNGRDLRAVELASLHRHLALVPQEPFLFATTVADNIRFGRPDASREAVEAAARAAELHEDIMEWPDGYDTVIGSGGRGVSEGQAQRINIARAIVKDAPILLLDEASSSLDSLTETRVQRALDHLMHGRVTFIVAHRLSTLRHADRILVLDGGRGVALGSHDTLLAECELYRALWAPQRGERVVESVA